MANVSFVVRPLARSRTAATASGAKAVFWPNECVPPHNRLSILNGLVLQSLVYFGGFLLLAGLMRAIDRGTPALGSGFGVPDFASRGRAWTTDVDDGHLDPAGLVFRQGVM